MARQRGLLDTSVAILIGRLPRAVLPDEGFISTISLAELAVGPSAAKSQEERQRREEHLQFAARHFTTLPFDEAAALAFGEVAGALRAAGKASQARAFDALIAAVAVAHGLPLYTCNPADFEHVHGLDLVAVPVPNP